MTQTCPKCGYVRQAADTAPAGECPKCGIVYAKYQARVAAVASEIPPPANPLSLESASIIAAAAGGALLLLKGSLSACTLTDVLLLVPFFFCFVPVLTYTFGDGLYMWNKYKMHFELYDSEENPVLSKVFYVFCIVATAVFVAFIFMPRGGLQHP